mgnify:CR=1 FL=1
MEMAVMDYGCTITSLKVRDRKGNFRDVVLGFDHLEGYLLCNHYVGCVVGRYANRIRNGEFKLEGQPCTVTVNHPPHHLHGGRNGFDKKVWSSRPIVTTEGEGISFSYTSPDGEEGFRGTLQVEVIYLLTQDHTLQIEYHAISDRDTIINMTHHAYFNLNADRQGILSHQLTLYSDHFLPVDEEMIPTGDFQSVTGTPFDFRTPKSVGQDLHVDDPQIARANGYDHCWVLSSDEPLKQAAVLEDTESECVMEIWTTEPGIQLYTANFLQCDVPGKNKMAFKPHLGLCLETQHFPDSPNQPEFPSTVLKAKDEFKSKTVLKFSV